MTEQHRRDGKILPLATQIEAWVKLQIFTRTVEPGGRLPSADTLAGLFDANVNTARKALARLALNGLVDIRHGRGVFVKRQVSPEQAAGIRGLLTKSKTAAADFGLATDDLAALLWTQVARRPSGRRFWYVDLPHPYRRTFREDIETAFGTPVQLIDFHGLESADGQDGNGSAPTDGDLIVTRFRLLGQVRSHFPSERIQVFPMRTHLDTRGMIRLASLQKDLKLGCVCLEEKFAKSLGRAIVRHGLKPPAAFAGVDTLRSVHEVYKDCDVVATSCAGLERLEEIFDGRLPKPTVQLTFEIDRESLRLARTWRDDPSSEDTTADTLELPKVEAHSREPRRRTRRA